MHNLCAFETTNALKNPFTSHKNHFRVITKYEAMWINVPFSTTSMGSSFTFSAEGGHDPCVLPENEAVSVDD